MEEHELQEMAAQLRKPQGENGLKTGTWMNVGNNQMIHDTLAVLNANGTDQILEIGMGSGFFVSEILEKSTGINYTGIDYSELMVEEAKKNNNDFIATHQAVFIHADAGDLPFSDARYTKIFTVNTIYFWGDEVRVLRELNRVLTPEGKLVIAFRPKRLIEHYPFTKYGFKLFAKEDVAALLTQNGFVVDEIKEHTEPDFELNGEPMEMGNVVVLAHKV